MLNYCRHLIIEFLRERAGSTSDEHVQAVLNEIVDGTMEASAPSTSDTQTEEASASA